MSEQDQLLGMLRHATVPSDYQKLDVAIEGRTVVVDTGPDDAVAVFEFDEQGTLRTVSVDESR